MSALIAPAAKAAADLERQPLAGLRSVLLDGEPSCVFDPELFTGPDVDEECPDELAARVAVAREVCAGCPVQRACLAYALVIRPPNGIWAGLTADEVAGLADAAGLPRAEAVA